MKIIINTDGGARGNPGPAGIGVVISDISGNILAEFKQYIGEATNNVAEYKALILGLQKVLEVTSEKLQVTSGIHLEIRMDSELIVRQMQGIYKIKEPTLQGLAETAKGLIKNFASVNFTHIRREYNKHADKLVNEAIDNHFV